MSATNNKVLTKSGSYFTIALAIISHCTAWSNISFDLLLGKALDHKKNDNFLRKIVVF